MVIKSRIFSILCFILSLFLTSLALAKEVNLYEQPKDGAKLLGKVDLANGIIPIFTSKEGDWMKVGDPRNGNVGWVKSSDMNTPGMPTSFTFTQKIVNDKSGPHSIQLLQYGKPATAPTKEEQEFYKKIQQQQEMIQQYTRKAIQEMMNQMNRIYDWNKTNGMSNFPVIMPVMIVPSSQKGAAQTPTSPAPTKK